MKTSKVTNGTASGQEGHVTILNSQASGPRKARAGTKRKSKTAGVIITQFTEDIPKGCSVPDFERKPIPLTIQEGKTATFKAVPSGEPKPEVTWRRAKGDMDDPKKFKFTYDKALNEYCLQVIKVNGDDADTYRCYASNEYGEAVCSVTLIIIDLGLKKKTKPETNKAGSKDPTEFRKLLKKRTGARVKQEKMSEEKMWELLMSADKKDYERICMEYGYTDFRGMLKKLTQMKKEREEEQAKYIDAISNLRHIQVNSEGSAEFEIEMELKDLNSRIFLYKDGVMIPFSTDMEMKHNLKRWGKKYIFSINSLMPEDAGLYQVDVEDTNVFSTDLPTKFIPVNFASPLKEVKCKERDDIMFECIITHPLPRLVWMFKNKTLEAGEKFQFAVSEDKLTHRMVVKDVMPVDKGIYSVAAGIRSSSAWLLVEKPVAHFTRGLFDIQARKGHSAELACTLSNAESDGTWFKDGVKLQSHEGLTICKDSSTHKLVFSNVQDSDAGKYRFEAEGHKTESHVIVADPPEIDMEELARLAKEPLVVKAGQNAVIKVPFVGRPPIKVSWYKDADELSEDNRTVVEKGPNHTRLLIGKCQRKDSGELRLKLKNESGTIEAVTKLIVLDKPTPPQGPVEVLDSSANRIEIKWRPPRDNGGKPIEKYTLERQQVGRNTWMKMGEVPGDTTTFATDKVEHGKKYCFRIQATSTEGISDVLETDDITAGTKAFPGPPAPPNVVATSCKSITLSWSPPHNTGGTRIACYILEKRKKGSSIWSAATDEPIKGLKHTVIDVVEGLQYEFRVAAVNVSGTGEPSVPSDFAFARDPMKPPGTVKDFRVTDSTYSTLSLSWTTPSTDEGDEAKGYYVEVKPEDSGTWLRYNSSPTNSTSYTLKGLKSMQMYFVRVIAVNDGGLGEPKELDNYILAMPPPVRPCFHNESSLKSFMAVKAGNTIRVNINFEASPIPDVIWLKDGSSLSKRATITNADGLSQLLIPASERSDSGVYTIMVKNYFGQECFSFEICVTDDPKPPGPVELDEKVPGTVTISWEPSPDEKRDEQLHYLVMKRDSSKPSWHTVADNIFNNKFTAVIVSGRQYYFRVFAKNDMGISTASDSPAWGIAKQKEKFTVKMPNYKQTDPRQAPKFTVRLKNHTVPRGYPCNMSCAVKGNPAPIVTWYRNNISIMENAQYYTSNVCGVCSMLITNVSPKDSGEYIAIAENCMGRAECTTRLNVTE